MTDYTATARREGRWWIVQCDQHPGALSQVARLEQAEQVHREAIAFVADVPAESVCVTVQPQVDPQISEELDEAQQLRSQAAEADRRATELKTHAAQRLKDQGLTVRDIGALLGVNYQYAAKLSSGQVTVRETGHRSARTVRQRRTATRRNSTTQP